MEEHIYEIEEAIATCALAYYRLEELREKHSDWLQVGDQKTGVFEKFSINMYFQ